MKGMTYGGQLAGTTCPKAEDPLHAAEQSSGGFPVLAGRRFFSEGRVVVELCFFGSTEDTSHAHIRNKTDHLHTAKETF